MRVISGKARGHALKTTRGLNTRPTSDRVKESIFNIIQAKLYDSIIIDLFAGSGGLGIEALSRNAGKAYFIDNDRNSIQTIKENLNRTGLINNSEIIQTDAINGIIKLNRSGIKADIIFLDPPYSKGFIGPTLEAICCYNILGPNGTVIVEHNIKDKVPNNIHKLKKYRTNRYGDVAVSFYGLGEGIK